MGISPHPTGLITWGIGGCLAATAGIFLLPVTGLSPSELTGIVFPALAAGLLGRFRSYPAAIAASFVIGVSQSIMVKYQIDQGIIQSLPFAVIILALVFGGTTVPGRGTSVLRLPRVSSGRVPRVYPVATAVVAAVMLLLLGTGWSTAFISTAIVAVVGISLVVATGFGGQISLAPFASLGITSLLVIRVSNTVHLGFVPSLATGVICGCVVGLVIGLPAMRVRGLDLAVVTLGIALMADKGILNETVFVGNINGLPVRAPTLFGWSIDPNLHPHRYALTCLAILTVVSLGVLTFRRSRGARRLLAVRGNERGAAALGISVVGAKIAAFSVSGGILGLAAVMLSFRFPRATFGNYDYTKSVVAVTFTVVGGIGYVAGGAFAGVTTSGGVVSNLFVGWNQYPSWAGVAGGAAVIGILLTNADGEIPRLTALGRRAISRGRDRKTTAGRPPASSATSSASNKGGRATVEGHAVVVARRGSLSVRELTVRYGQVTAVDSASLDVDAGKVLGVVGPNGAGKTSLIDAITGFTSPTGGRVELDGVAFGEVGAIARARRGLSRTFQNLELFTELTVRENLLAASDPRDIRAYATGFVHSGPELTDFDAEIVAALDLGAVLDHDVERLPVGRQHLVALARAVCARPKFLCLDEPTAGLAGHERREVVSAVRMLAERHSIGFLVVEHNLDVIEALCDELVVLNFGAVIARGQPAPVLRSDIVRRAYLGTAEPVPADAEGVEAMG